MLTFKVTFTSKDVLNLFLLAKCSFYMKYIWGEGLKVCGKCICVCLYTRLHVHRHYWNTLK